MKKITVSETTYMQIKKRVAEGRAFRHEAEQNQNGSYTIPVDADVYLALVGLRKRGQTFDGAIMELIRKNREKEADS